MRVLFVFFDGVGLGVAEASRNAFVAEPPRRLTSLLDGALPVAAAAPVRARLATLAALDATLGVAGTPQSGTGQTALLTGRNAAKEYGRHFGPWVPASLRAVVREQSVLARAGRAGRNVAFATAYPEEVKAAVDADLPSDKGDGRLRRAARYLTAGPPLAALGAGVLDRHTDALERGDAVASEITNEGWRDRLGRHSVPEISAQDAGANLARIAARHDLTLFAHYATDYAGHQQSLETAMAAIRVIDDFLAGIVDALPADVLLIASSDHGNLEDITTDHTLNPVPGLVVGRGHGDVAGEWTSILDVAPAILRVLGVE